MRQAGDTSPKRERRSPKPYPRLDRPRARLANRTKAGQRHLGSLGPARYLHDVLQDSGRTVSETLLNCGSRNATRTWRTRNLRPIPTSAWASINLTRACRATR